MVAGGKRKEKQTNHDVSREINKNRYSAIDCKLTWDEIGKSLEKYVLTAYKNIAESHSFFHPVTILSQAVQRGKTRSLHFPKCCCLTLEIVVVHTARTANAADGCHLRKGKERSWLNILTGVFFVLDIAGISGRPSTVLTSVRISVV